MGWGTNGNTEGRMKLGVEEGVWALGNMSLWGETQKGITGGRMLEETPECGLAVCP